MLTEALKKGSAEFLILSLLEHQDRHGYDLSKLIESRSRGALRFNVSSLYPLLHRMDERGWITGMWVERPGERRRRFYRITREGRAALVQQRKSWLEFVDAISLVSRLKRS